MEVFGAVAAKQVAKEAAKQGLSIAAKCGVAGLFFVAAAGLGVFVYKFAKSDKHKQLDESVKKLGQMLETANQNLQIEKTKSKKMSDPKYYNQAKTQLFLEFKSNLKSCQFNSYMKRQPGQKRHIVVGLISAGKSSLLMKATGVYLETGQGQTTTQLKPIHTEKLQGLSVTIFDSPGFNKDFSCYDPQKIALLHAMDQIFVVYRDSLKNNLEDLLEIIYQIKPNKSINLIRTHCDLFKPFHKKTCEQEIQTDKKIMENLKIPCRIFAFSSEEGMDFKDNKKVISLILGREL